MKRNANVSNSTAEAQLLAQLAEIEAKISELILEKETLQRLITRLRHSSVPTRDVTRKNSFDRILLENTILETLRGAQGRPVSAAELLKAAQSVKFDLKPNTFRSYIHRLYKSGAIQPYRAMAGYWMIKSQSE
jgi:DNA-binding response OmpR family regulator